MRGDESIYPVNERATELNRFSQSHPIAKATRNSCEQRLLTGKHVLIIGTTGSGKTYFAARFAHKYLDCYLFVNSSQEEEVSRVCEVTTSTPQEVFQALEEGYRKIEYIPPIDTDLAKAHLQVIRERFFEIGLQSGLGEGQFWITVFIDELQDFAEKARISDVNNYFRRGRHHRVRVVGITLMPQDISKTALAQTENQVIFISGNFQTQYFKAHGIPYNTYEPWLKNQYHYVLLNQKGEATECYPIV